MAQKAIISLIFVFSQFTYASCNWGTISKTADGYLYSRDCHLEVGKALEDLDLKNQQVDILKQSRDLYRQSYQNENERAELWFNKAKNLQDSQYKQHLYNDLEKVLYFSLGVVVMYGAVKAVK